MNAFAKISDVAAKYMGLLLIIVVVIAYFVPNLFVGLNAHLTILLGIVMFGMGLTLTASDFKLVLTRPIPVLAGVAAQFMVMPLVAFSLAYIMDLPPAMAAGLVLLGCVPGGTASNVMVFLAKGDLPLSITMTSVATLLAPIATPLLLLLLAGQWMPVDPISMFVSIVQVIIIPIVLGLTVKRILPKAVEVSLPAVPLISIAAILIIGGAVVAANGANLLAAGIPLFIAVVLHNTIGLLLGYFIAALCKFDRKRKKAISLEVGMQNSALSVQLATVHLEPISAIAGVGGAIWHNISGPFLASYWGRKDTKEEAETPVVELSPETKIAGK